MTTRRPLADRFWPKVDKNGPIQPHMGSPCWVWTGAVTSCGYGSVNRGGRNSAVSAHIAAWELQNGPVREGMCVLHKCDFPLCVNTDHLFLGTKKDNTADAIKKGRHHFKDAPMLYGSLSPCAKISETDASRMRMLRAAGLTYKQISQLYPVSATEVRRIVLGERFNPSKTKGTP
jgi:hypothetical protein